MTIGGRYSWHSCDIVETDEHPFIIDYLSSGAEFVKGFWSRSINAGERGFNAREIEPSRDAVLAMVKYDMVFYLPTLQGREQHSFKRERAKQL